MRLSPHYGFLIVSYYLTMRIMHSLKTLSVKAAVYVALAASVASGVGASWVVQRQAYSKWIPAAQYDRMSESAERAAYRLESLEFENARLRSLARRGF